MNEDHTFQLKARQLEFLKEMAAKYNLDDESKALRCLINYACSEPTQQDEIFQTVRCMDC